MVRTYYTHFMAALQTDGQWTLVHKPSGMQMSGERYLCALDARRALKRLMKLKLVTDWSVGDPLRGLSETTIFKLRRALDA